MSCSSCYFCQISHSVRLNPLGTKDEPLGTCHNCWSFACGHHGDRDKTVAKFRCVMCFSGLMTASAAHIYQTQMQITGEANRGVIGAMLVLYDAVEVSAVSSVEEFFERHPRIGEYLQNRLEIYEANWNQIENPALRTTILQFPPPARELLKAAGILVGESGAREQYALILNDIADVINRRG